MSKLTRIRPRRLVLIGIIVVLVVFGIWTWWGNTHIGVTTIEVGSTSVPREFDGYRIVQVSDLHNQEFGENEADLLALIEQQDPDIIVITGDLIDSRNTNVDVSAKFVRQAVKIAPVYYVTGNHENRVPQDYQALEAAMNRAGATVLRNQSELVRQGGASILLAGIDDPTFTTSGNETSSVIYDNIQQALGESTQDAFTVLLSHRPEAIDVYEQCGIDLAITGHAHGGQVRIPGIGGLIAPGQGWFPTYTEGLYQQGQTQMVVSRGLGNSLVPVRINNPAELVTVVLHREGEEVFPLSDNQDLPDGWSEWDQAVAPNYVREAGPAVIRYSIMGAGQRSVASGPLDDLGRSTWSAGVMTNQTVADAMADGREEIPTSESPSGWQGNEQVQIEQPDGTLYHGYFWNRSHLLADSLGGHAVRQNLIRGTRMQNVGSNDGQGGMAYCETIARSWLEDNPDGLLYYSATALYEGDELVPRAVLVDMRSSDDQVDSEVIVYNAAKGYTIDYAQGTFAAQG